MLFRGTGKDMVCPVSQSQGARENDHLSFFQSRFTCLFTASVSMEE